MNKFEEIKTTEQMDINGGFAVTAFVIGICVGGCITAGAIYGYNKEAQGK